MNKTQTKKIRCRNELRLHFNMRLLYNLWGIYCQRSLISWLSSFGSVLPRLHQSGNIHYCFKMKIYFTKNHKEQLINEYTQCCEHKAAAGMEPPHCLGNNSMLISANVENSQCWNAESDSCSGELTQNLIQDFISITILLNNLCEPLPNILFLHLFYLFIFFFVMNKKANMLMRKANRFFFSTWHLKVVLVNALKH